MIRTPEWDTCAELTYTHTHTHGGILPNIYEHTTSLFCVQPSCAFLFAQYGVRGWDEDRTEKCILKRTLIGSRGHGLPVCITAVGTELSEPGRGRDQDNTRKGPKVRHKGKMRDEMKKKRWTGREVLKEEWVAIFAALCWEPLWHAVIHLNAPRREGARARATWSKCSISICISSLSVPLFCFLSSPFLSVSPPVVLHCNVLPLHHAAAHNRLQTGHQLILNNRYCKHLQREMLIIPN